MTSKSASSLTWFALILILLGLMVGSPAGSFAACVVAGLCAGTGLLIGGGRQRIWAAGVLILAALLAIAYYSGFQREMTQYKAKTPLDVPAKIR